MADENQRSQSWQNKVYITPRTSQVDLNFIRSATRTKYVSMYHNLDYIDDQVAASIGLSRPCLNFPKFVPGNLNPPNCIIGPVYYDEVSLRLKKESIFEDQIDYLDHFIKPEKRIGSYQSLEAIGGLKKEANVAKLKPYWDYVIFAFL